MPVKAPQQRSVRRPADSGGAADRQVLAISTFSGLDRQRERHFAKYRRLMHAEDDLARYALEEVERIDQGARARGADEPGG